MPTDSKKSFKVSMDGLQKIALALLVPIVVIFVFSAIQMRSAYQRLDEIPLKLEKSSRVSTILKREMGKLDKLKENLKRSSERHSELLSGVDVRMRSSFDLDGLKSWRSRAGILRAQLKQDQGRLQQFDAGTNPILNKLALSLKKLLQQEDEQWISLQQFLEKQTDKAVNPGEKAQFYQNYMNEFLDTIRALSAYRGAINDFKDKLQTLINGENSKLRSIEAESINYQNSLQYHMIMVIICLVLGVIASCGVYGLRIRKERRSRERRESARSVEYGRRKSDRSVEYGRRKGDGKVENDRRKDDRRVGDERREIDRSVENNRRKGDRSVEIEHRESDRS